jgi:hypothetical protein
MALAWVWSSGLSGFESLVLQGWKEGLMGAGANKSFVEMRNAGLNATFQALAPFFGDGERVAFGLPLIVQLIQLSSVEG